MDAEAQKTALEQDAAQKAGGPPEEPTSVVRARRAVAAGLPASSSEETIAARERTMRDIAEKAAALRPGIDPATGQPPLRPDEAMQAMQGKPGAETVTIASATLVIQLEQKQALISKIVAGALAETARSLLPELNEPGTKTREVTVRDAAGQMVKSQVPRHNLERMKEVLSILDGLATQAERWDVLGDKAQVRVPPSAAPTVTVPKTDPDMQPEVVPPGAGDL
jgi:hypothetical protein